MLTGKTGVIKLAHISVKEYLTSGYIQNSSVMQVQNLSFNKEVSDSVISQVCLAYLLQFNTSQSLDVNLKKSFPLVKYAARYWSVHACADGKKEISEICSICVDDEASNR